MQFAMMGIKDDLAVLVAAREVQALEKLWKTKEPVPVIEPLEETGWPLKVVYGAYMPSRHEINGAEAREHAEAAKGFGLGYLDNDGIGKILGLTDLWLMPEMRQGHLSKIPFAALVETPHEFDNKGVQSVAAFLRWGNMDFATNLINRKGVFAIHREEKRLKAKPDEATWREMVDRERVGRAAAAVG